jgi:hypothetical protein
MLKFKLYCPNDNNKYMPDRYCQKCLNKVEPTKIAPLQNPLWKRDEIPDWWDCPTCETVHLARTFNADRMRDRKIKKLL